MIHLPAVHPDYQASRGRYTAVGRSPYHGKRKSRFGAGRTAAIELEVERCKALIAQDTARRAG